VELADIVKQREPRTRPLYIHFTFGSQGEAMHPLLDTDIGKDRFHDLQPSGINALSCFTIDLCLHCIDQVRLLPIHLNGNIPERSIRLARTARPQSMGDAVLEAGVDSAWE
jgi:hypothetical protein